MGHCDSTNHENKDDSLARLTRKGAVRGPVFTSKVLAIPLCCQRDLLVVKVPLPRPVLPPKRCKAYHYALADLRHRYNAKAANFSKIDKD
eukprot:1426744-Pleurochrysis_carterae.AAC.9